MDKLVSFLSRVPGVRVISHSGPNEPHWWVKFSIDVEHRLAWRVIQELGHVLNYLSPAERLPTTFKPVSPPPYMNGGPRDYLAWIIEADEHDIAAAIVAEWLEGRMPRPVESIDEWLVGMDDDDEQDDGEG